MVKVPLDHVFLGTAAVATKNDHVIQESASGGSKTEGFLLVQHYNSDRGARFCSAIAKN